MLKLCPRESALSSQAKRGTCFFAGSINTPYCCRKLRSLVLINASGIRYFAELTKSFFSRFTSTRAMLLFFPMVSPATGVLPIPTT